MKCDELKEVENPIEWGLYYNKAEVDEAIAELKHQVWEADERAIDAGATSHEKMQECEAKDKEIAYLRRLALHALSGWAMGLSMANAYLPRGTRKKQFDYFRVFQKFDILHKIEKDKWRKEKDK